VAASIDNALCRDYIGVYVDALAEDTNWVVLYGQDNVLFLRAYCNSSKCAKNVDEWLKTQPESSRRNYAAYKKRKAEAELDD